MNKHLYRLHRFLAGQSFYPIVLSSALAMATYAGRVLVSGKWVVYANLVWNLFLAWIPYVFSMLAAAIQRLFPRRWWLLIVPGGMWLIFLPNAAYIVTDFFHLMPRASIPLWYDILMLTTFSWTGIFLAIASLRTMQILVSIYIGKFLAWTFAGLALGLTGLGIYLGRFERWNSWDLLAQPDSVLADVVNRLANPFSNLRFFGFTALFTAFLVVSYLTFTSMHHVAETEE